MMVEAPRFESPPDWSSAAALVTFPPVVPAFTSGAALQSLRVHVSDHKGRPLALEGRTLEAYYSRFAFSQSRKGPGEAIRWALEVSYGRDPRPVWILGREGRGYELGPEPPPEEIDPRSPSVVAWADGEMFYFLASGELTLIELIDVAQSIHAA